MVATTTGLACALLLDSEDPDILDLYLTRAARRVPHAWVVADEPDVLEVGHLDDLKKRVRKFVAAKYGGTAGRSEEMQLRRGNAVIGAKRRSGFPVMLRLDYPENRQPAAVFRAVREECSELLVLYTVSPERPVDLPDNPEIVCQLPPLGITGYEQVIGTYGALIDHCHNTTPKEKVP